jgi:hypothetical protein
MNALELSPLPRPESVRPGSIGRLLFHTFEGYDTETDLPLQLSFLYKYHLVSSLVTGAPRRHLTFHDREGTHWERNTYMNSHVGKTNEHTAYSPDLDPEVVDYAPAIITVTDGNHRWMDITQSMVAIQKESGAIHPFWYNKIEPVINLHPLGDLRLIDRLLSNEPAEDSPNGALIQLWQLSEASNGNEYELQANLCCLGISLNKFLLVMAASPYMIEQMETKLHAPGRG